MPLLGRTIGRGSCGSRHRRIGLFKSLAGIVYLIIGLIVANGQGYLAINDIGSALSAALAILLWPLVLFGVNLHLSI